jgi:hypothetical protein
VAAAAAPRFDELKMLKVPELKEQLRKRGLLLSGKKEELVARLLAGWRGCVTQKCFPLTPLVCGPTGGPAACGSLRVGLWAVGF